MQPRMRRCVRISSPEESPPMPDDQSDYQVGPGKPPLHTRFQGGRVRQSRQPRRQDLADIARRGADDKWTAPEVHQARGDHRSDGREIGERGSTRDKMLIDMMKEV